MSVTDCRVVSDILTEADIKSLIDDEEHRRVYRDELARDESDADRVKRYRRALVDLFFNHPGYSRIIYEALKGDPLAEAAIKERESRLKGGRTKSFVELPCLGCGAMHIFGAKSNEARGVFNVFCSDNDGRCEDIYAGRQ